MAPNIASMLGALLYYTLLSPYVSIQTVTQSSLSTGRSEQKQKFPQNAKHEGETGNRM